MKKAKTKKNLFSVLSAILGVVFAFITGVTYCVSSLNPTYRSNPNSTSAYMGNQQYVMINDTIDNPVAYGEGTHNFEIAMQYSISYDFDVRLKYSMTWSNGETADNVILRFANRDNVIYDEEYIFLADGISAGSGKVTFITGVDFVDTNDETFYGQSLTINIVSEKIYKVQTQYSTSHSLYADAIYTTGGTSLAADMWLAHKPQTTTSTKTNILMYNYRRSYDYGIPYAGHQTAYKRIVTSTTVGEETTKRTTSSTWLGGNKSYAGTGMYVVTGSKDIKLTVKVEGVWYAGAGVEASDLISENSIKYNYSDGWVHKEWVTNKLWEVRTFEYIIPANSACFIDILDSIEITSDSKNKSTLKYDTYRIVTNGITVNAGGGDELFDYTKTEDQKFIRHAELAVDTTSNLTGDTYSTKDVEIVNTSIYSNGLYESAISAEQQTFNTNISLINNTAETKSVTLTYQLYYYIRNGATLHTDSNGYRAAEYVEGVGEGDSKITWTNEQAFAENLSYGYAVADANSRLTSSVTTTVVVAPYSSVKLLDGYTVSSALQGDLASTSGNETTNYDVWTYLVVNVAKDSEDKDIISTVSSPSTANLTIETTTSGNSVSLSVKNNTTSIIKDVTISSFSISEMTKVVETDADTYTVVNKKPPDWAASYWKYYSKDDDGNFVQLTSNPLAEKEEKEGIDYFVANTYYEKKQPYYETNILTLTVNATLFLKSSDTITSGAKFSLQPGESAVFATATTTNTNHVLVNGHVTSSSVEQVSGVMLINNGTENAYLINHTENSYYVRFTGAVDSDETNFQSGSVTVNETTSTHNYYIGILRPGQIIPVAMTEAGEMTSDDLITVSGDFDGDGLISKEWSPEIVELLTKYFALVKTTT